MSFTRSFYLRFDEDHKERHNVYKLPFLVPDSKIDLKTIFVYIRKRLNVYFLLQDGFLILRYIIV